jgi:hypothetical protein
VPPPGVGRSERPLRLHPGQERGQVLAVRQVLLGAAQQPADGECAEGRPVGILPTSAPRPADGRLVPACRARLREHPREGRPEQPQVDRGAAQLLSAGKVPRQGTLQRLLRPPQLQVCSVVSLRSSCTYATSPECMRIAGKQGVRIFGGLQRHNVGDGQAERGRATR